MNVTQVFAEFWALYSGKREVLGHALISHDPYDQFAWCQGWRFAIAGYLTFQKGESVPDFRPAPSGPEDTYEYEELLHIRPDTDALWYAFNVLSRYREWLRIAGKDY
jgi:hypothetical protein